MNNQFCSASLFAVILFILSFLSTACFSQNNQIIHISTTGLKSIYLVHDQRATNIEIHFVIQAGEADHDYEEGLAHYVEHMVWLNIQGTGLNNHEQHSNAWTTHLATGYRLAGPREDLSSITSTIARAFEPVRLDSNFLAEEREIIVNEYYLRSGNDPEHSIIENLTRRLYQQSRLSRSVLGTPDDILKYQISQALSLHRATHRPGNTIALVYGNVSVKEVNDVFTLEFGLQTAPLTESVLPPHTGLSQQRIVETFESSDIIQPKLFYGKIIQLPVQFQLLEYSNRIAQLQLLSKILDSSLAGGLAQPLRFDAFIARSFGLSLRLLGDQYLEM